MTSAFIAQTCATVYPQRMTTEIAGIIPEGVMTAVVWFVRAFGPFAFGLVLVLLVVAR